MLFGGDISWKDVRCASTQDTHGAFAFSCRDSLSARNISAQGHEFKVPVVLQRSPPFRRMKIPTTHLICNALVPNTLARSYFVIYGVVLLFSFGIFLSLSPCSAFFFPPPVAFWPPASAPSPTGTIVWPFASPSPWPDSMCRARSRLSVPSGFSTSSGSWGSKTGSSSSKVASAGS